MFRDWEINKLPEVNKTSRITWNGWVSYHTQCNRGLQNFDQTPVVKNSYFLKIILHKSGILKTKRFSLV